MSKLSDLDIPNFSSMGGKARAAKLTPQQRSEAARVAAEKRWGPNPLQRATHSGILHIAELEIPCAVLEDGTRVLSERGVLRGLGLGKGGKGMISAALEDGGRLPLFLASKNLRPFIDNELAMVFAEPIMYRPPVSPRPARGLDARLIPKVCEVWLRARDAGVLRPNQLPTAAKADVLMRGLANVGIIGLIDEATGYQEVRDRLALQAILDAYLARELAAWAKRFPDELYKQMFRLRNWTWDDLKQGRGQGPRVVGRYTNDLVYSRLAPGILEELQKLNPPDDNGRRRVKHHQWLSEDIGHPALSHHLHAIIGLMRASASWEEFTRLVDRAFPRKTDLKDLPLFTQPA